MRAGPRRRSCVGGCAPLILAALAGCWSEAGWQTHRPPSPGSDPWKDLLLSPAACRAGHPGRLTSEQVRRDFVVLERILRDGHAPYEHLERARGLNWDQRLAVIHDRLEQLGPDTTVGSFADWLLVQLAFIQDCHFSLRGVDEGGRRHGGTTCAPVEAYTSELVFDGKGRSGWVVASSESGKLSPGTELTRCASLDLDQAIGPTYVDGGLRSILVVPATKPPDPLECSVADGSVVTLRLRRLRSRSRHRPESPAFEVKRGAVPILRVSSFSDGRSGELLALEGTPTALRRAPSFVVDLRGNSGGVDRFARSWFGRMSAQRLSYGRVESLESDVTIQGGINSITCDLAGEGIDENSRSYLEERRRIQRERLDVLREHFKVPAKRWTVSHPHWGGKALTTYQGWIVLLVDKGCASACENFVTFAKQMPHVLVVGENTHGMGIQGDVESYRLPESGLWVRAATKLFFNPRSVPDFPEGWGYLPDLWLDVDDAEGAAVRIAECLTNNRCASDLLTHAKPSPPARERPWPGMVFSPSVAPTSRSPRRRHRLAAAPGRDATRRARFSAACWCA
jgi:peptidase S41-like protein